MPKIVVSVPTEISVSRDQLLKLLQDELDIVGYSINTDNEIVRYERTGYSDYDYVVVNESELPTFKVNRIRVYYNLINELD